MLLKWSIGRSFKSSRCFNFDFYFDLVRILTNPIRHSWRLRYFIKICIRYSLLDIFWPLPDFAQDASIYCSIWSHYWFSQLLISIYSRNLLPSNFNPLSCFLTTYFIGFNLSPSCSILWEYWLTVSIITLSPSNHKFWFTWLEFTSDIYWWLNLITFTNFLQVSSKLWFLIQYIKIPEILVIGVNSYFE